MRLQALLVGRIMVNVQAQLTNVKAEATKLESVAVYHGQEKYPLILTACGPRHKVQNLLVFANELVAQFPQVCATPFIFFIKFQFALASNQTKT